MTISPALVSMLVFQLISSHGSPAPSSKPSASNAGGIGWTAPKAWSVAPSSSTMRVVTYKIPAAQGDSEGGEMAVFFFGPGQGGAIDSNVQRWFGQFERDPKAPSPEKQEKTKVGGLSVTLVATEGTYASGMPGSSMTPKAGWALKGAIAEGAKGPVFFKLVGPKKTVAAAGADFDAFVKSLKKVE